MSARSARSPDGPHKGKTRLTWKVLPNKTLREDASRILNDHSEEDGEGKLSRKTDNQVTQSYYIPPDRQTKLWSSTDTKRYLEAFCKKATGIGPLRSRNHLRGQNAEATGAVHTHNGNTTTATGVYNEASDLGNTNEIYHDIPGDL